ncbi:MAG: 4-hydroxy-tetrahydrodipicolinate synthase [Halanaerobiaceae bacterium]
MYEHFGEVLTAMVTPFNDSLDVDYKKVEEVAQYLIDNGSDGLVVLGTTGEVPTLTKEEKLSILETVVKKVGDKAKVVAGTGSYSTFSSIELTQKAEEIGVDGIMLVGPYYNKPPQAGLYKHYSMIAEKTSLPVMIYNVPGRTSRNIEPDTVSRLSRINNIIAVKEARGDIAQVAEISRKTDDDFYIYSGDDNLTLPVLSVGGQGVVSVASHVAGNQIKSMINYYKNGDKEKACNLNKKLGSLFSGIFITTNPIPIKAALNMKGIDVGSLRPPLLELDKSKKEQLKEILQNLNLI